KARRASTFRTGVLWKWIPVISGHRPNCPVLLPSRDSPSTKRSFPSGPSPATFFLPRSTAWSLRAATPDQNPDTGIDIIADYDPELERGGAPACLSDRRHKCETGDDDIGPKRQSVAYCVLRQAISQSHHRD